MNNDEHLWIWPSKNVDLTIKNDDLTIEHVDLDINKCDLTIKQVVELGYNGNIMG